MNWQAELEFTPVVTPDGKTLRTLRDAQRYMLALPADKVTAAWVHAGKAVRKAAEQPNQLFLLCARIAVYKALYGSLEPVKRPSKAEVWREKRRQIKKPAAG